MAKFLFEKRSNILKRCSSTVPQRKPVLLRYGKEVSFKAVRFCLQPNSIKFIRWLQFLALLVRLPTLLLNYCLISSRIRYCFVNLQWLANATLAAINSLKQNLDKNITLRVKRFFAFAFNAVEAKQTEEGWRKKCLRSTFVSALFCFRMLCWPKFLASNRNGQNMLGAKWRWKEKKM